MSRETPNADFVYQPEFRVNNTDSPTVPVGLANPTVDRLLDLFEFSDKVQLRENDIYGLSKRCQLFRDLFGTIYDSRGGLYVDAVFQAGGEEKLRRVRDAVSKMESFLYPYFSKDYHIQTLTGLLRSYNGQRGIVISTGNTHYRYALHLIQSLRMVLNCTLPIEVFYNGVKDLSANRAAALKAISGVRVVDLSKMLNPVGIGGWSMKPFMILFSSFSEVIFMDADALFLQDPAVLFQQKGYIETGAVLFRDRTLLLQDIAGKRVNYTLSIVPSPSDKVVHGRLFRNMSTDEGDSGVLVFDKARTFHVLLLNSKMNTDYFKKDFYKAFHGDKETFWIAFEAMKTPYFMSPNGGGAVGFLDPDNNYVCGGLYHPDENRQPLWFNGGIVPNKRFEGDDAFNLTHWATDSTWHNVSWITDTETKPSCMRPAKSEDMGLLKGPYAEAAKGIIRVWNEVVRPLTT
ncbi:mannosyltransferase putative-domain-containing protein [Polychytrium aggregatum]|uniref:mannosyltransferase putative-domain-containing protein n=1 Tax=Polychytrium aggregatum TaxID=110093 RepID=UPI0022FDE4DE|nr:mannosyltransferase putative-domain-containing protein [Polychytrium aggregatum]KAI9203828.1 mannosyltransferase putative-domain-containing protein [Polychytrium aggregatum]